MKIISVLLFALVFYAAPAFAQVSAPVPVQVPAQAPAAPAAAEKPLEITADQTLEWHRNDKKFVARGSVVVKQGDVTIKAAVITAAYAETASSSFDIQQLTAEGGVIIESQGNIAEGDKAVYDVKTGKAVMTGNGLSLRSPEQVVTARDSFEYYVTEGRLTANGAARAVRGTDTLTAESMSAWFTQGTDGARRLSRLSADNHVNIITATETVSGDKGIYEAASNIATLTGHVKISRGPNVLEGDKAEVNLTTNVSTMIGSPAQGGGRVRGVFYPESGPSPALTR